MRLAALYDWTWPFSSCLSSWPHFSSSAPCSLESQVSSAVFDFSSKIHVQHIPFLSVGFWDVSANRHIINFNFTAVSLVVDCSAVAFFAWLTQKIELNWKWLFIAYCHKVTKYLQYAIVTDRAGVQPITATRSPGLPFIGRDPRGSYNYMDHYSFTDPRGMEGWVVLHLINDAELYPAF